MLTRLMEDGKYHYNLRMSPGPGPGPLYKIIIAGTNETPSFSDTSATPQEHEEWIEFLRRSGFEVRLIEVDEASHSRPNV